MKKQIFFYAILLPTFVFGSNIDLSELNYRISGYIKNETSFDTRQVSGNGNDHFLFFPEKKILDQNKKDINSRGQVHMAAIETRVRTTISGININQAKAVGVIEADYLGIASLDLSNIFRLRHAYIQLDWENVSLQLGQTWHPLSTFRKCNPITVSFNRGVPFNLRTFNPLIQATYHTEHFAIIGAATSQVSAISDGPDGPSSTYIRNALIPNLHVQIHGLFGDHVTGVGVDYKRLRPRIVTNNDFKTSESINSIVAIGFLSLNFPTFFIHTKISYAQNAREYTSFGGYAVHSINPVTDERTYTNISIATIWSEFVYRKHKKIEPAIFIGFLKNLGAGKTIIPNLVDNNNIIERRIFGRGLDIDYLFRISPRCKWYINNFMIAAELEYTRAAFGTIDNKGKVTNTTPVGITRLLLAAYYYF